MDSDDSDTWSNVSGSEAEDLPYNFNDWLDDYAPELWFLKLAKTILMALIQCGIVVVVVEPLVYFAFLFFNENSYY